MKIRALVDDLQNNERYHWRIDKPFEYLNKYGVDAQKLLLDEEVPLDTDIVILPKMCVRAEDQEEALEYFEYLRASNILIVYDADDDMWTPSFTEYMTKLQYKKEGPEHLNALINELELRREASLWTLMQCDAAIVSTAKLAGIVNTYSNLPTFVVNNAIDVKAFDAALNKENTLVHPHYVTIGWAGGSRPQSELTPMLEAWQQIALMHDNVKFVIGGWQPDLTKYTNIQEKLIKVDWTGVEAYANNMQVDIGCVCVGDSDFSLSKSPIKAWEFALAGAMVVGSRSLYGEEPILVCDNVDDWVKILHQYVNDYESREAIASLYEKRVRVSHDIEYEWVYWADAYQKILNTVRKDERNIVAV